MVCCRVGLPALSAGAKTAVFEPADSGYPCAERMARAVLPRRVRAAKASLGAAAGHGAPTAAAEAIPRTAHSRHHPTERTAMLGGEQRAMQPSNVVLRWVCELW